MGRRPSPARSSPVPRRAAALRRGLLAWWDAGHRAFPWRFPQHGADPYRVWLAEVMAQQTRVETVVPYYLRFVERWPTLAALAAADDDDVLAAWAGLGYYARCRNLLAAARAALERHGGLPATREDLRALPGLGPYTAGAVASIAFAVPVPAVDGNAARVLARLAGVPGDPTTPRVKARLEAVAAALVDPDRPGDWNQALMELGSRVCTPRNPRCGACPLAPDCVARREGRQGSLPGRRARPAPVDVLRALLRVERAGRVLLRREPGTGLLGGLWALPGLDVPRGEDPAGFLRRHVHARLGLSAVVGEEVATVTRMLTHRRLEMRIFAGRLVGPPPRTGADWAFTREGDATSLPSSTAMRRAIEASAGSGRTGARARGGRKSPRSTGRP